MTPPKPRTPIKLSKQTSTQKKVIMSPSPVSQTPAQPAKKVITTDEPKAQTVETSLEVKAADVTPPLDLSQAVDSGGQPINVGMYCDLYFCKVMGLRTSPDNRLNIVLLPAQNIIVTNEPGNPLNGLADGKCILVSGYHTVTYASLAERTAKINAINAILQAASDAPPEEPAVLPSNFLTPSFS